MSLFPCDFTVARVLAPSIVILRESVRRSRRRRMKPLLGTTVKDVFDDGSCREGVGPTGIESDMCDYFQACARVRPLSIARLR
jgi:hypothetical protein